MLTQRFRAVGGADADIVKKARQIPARTFAGRGDARLILGRMRAVNHSTSTGNVVGRSPKIRSAPKPR